MGDTRFSAQDGVETQFQSCSSRVFAFVEVSDGSDGESAVRVLSGGELLHVEASRSRTLAEDGELLHHAILDVGDAFVVEFPVVAFCFSSGAHEFSEFHGVDVREDFVHAVADAVHLDFKHRVAFVLFFGAAHGVLLPGHEVHIHFKLRQTAGHELPVAA